MIKELFEKLKESVKSIFPVAGIVVITYFMPHIHMTAKELAIFLISAVFMVIGMSLFDVGAEMAMTPMGDHIGAGLTKTKKIGLLFSVCFLMGLLITIAEPDLAVLAAQVSAVISPTVLICSVGIGVGLFLVIAVAKIIKSFNLGKLLMLFYALIFAIATLLLESGHSLFIPTSFDSGGVTTGPVTVPFIMALGVGIASIIGGKKAKENSFGILALCSVGPIIAVMILSLFSKGSLSYSVPDYSMEAVLAKGIGHTLLSKMWEVAKALLLIIAAFMLLNIMIFKLPKKKIIKILVGIVYTFAGLVIFLTAIDIGFIPIGYLLGNQLSAFSPIAVILFGFIIGMVVVLAEPAVHVLNNQVEELTGGTVSKRSMLIALSAGVGISIGLSMIRIVYGFSLLYYIVPGYMIALLLSLLVPGMYSAIAFDSGGVASGTLTSSFLLPMAIGSCMALSGENRILQDAFGIVAMVAMIPLITIQFLGFRAIAKRKIHENKVIRNIMKAEDEQIIYFDV